MIETATSLAIYSNSEKTGHLVYTNKMSPDIIPKYTHKDTHLHTHTHTHTHTHKIKNNNTIATNLTTGYTLCDINAEDTIRHNIVLMASTSRVYIPYPLGTIIK